jgi:hypothetical protein
VTPDERRHELRDRVRTGEAPPPDAAVVIRGGPDTPSLLRTHAKRLHRRFLLDRAPTYGISVFVVLDDLGPASEAGVLSDQLRSYPAIYRSTVGRLHDVGLALLPTFRRPHYTVLLPDLDAVDGLARALGDLVPNPYTSAQE